MKCWRDVCLHALSLLIHTAATLAMHAQTCLGVKQGLIDSRTYRCRQHSNKLLEDAEIRRV